MVMSRKTSTLVPKPRARAGVTLPPRPRSIHSSDNTQSVLAAVDDLIGLDPGHHVTQFLTDHLDLMLTSEAAHGLQLGGAGLDLENELTREFAGLDLFQDLLHFLLGLLGDDARTAREIAVFSGVGDRVAHVGDAALIHQVDDELQLVQTFEEGHLGRVAASTSVSNPACTKAVAPPHSTACSPNKSVSVSSRKLVSMTPARPPPLALAYDNASSFALPLAF